MAGLMGPLAFDAAAQRAKREIQDALGLLPQRIKPTPMPASAMPQPSPVNVAVANQGMSLQGHTPFMGGQLSGQAVVGPQGIAGGQARFSAPVGMGGMSLSAQMGQGGRFQGAQAGYGMPFAGGDLDLNAEYNPMAGPRFGLNYRRQFQEGGLASSVRSDPVYHDRDVDFINTRNQHMREIAGKTAYAKGGLAMAEGGAWTRKEGKNPEGGLNAKGRASLKAQGHDIKPPVSAKQAKKSPKAAARRRSFCARMSGMPGPMKDEKGRPTRKALSLRKWDC